MINLPEPKWGQDTLVFLNDYVNKHYLLSKYIPFTADIFVFSYPIYLSRLYIYGIYKKDTDYKNAALYIFFSGFGSVLLNLIIQLFIEKQRPEQLLISADKLIFSHVPDSPFPSDHAALSAAIATSIMLWGIKNNKKNFVNRSIVFWIFCIIMSLSRVAAGVHWPTDIIVGIFIGILIPYLLISGKIFKILLDKIFPKIISIEKFIMKKLFGIVQ